MTLKDIFGLAATLLAFIGMLPYLRDMYFGRVKPHFFTWLIWFLVTAIAFWAILSAGGGAGAWAIGYSSFMLLIVTIYAYFRGEKERTRSDWISFIAALAAIPLWLLTNNPLFALALICIIDSAATWPTLRKSWHKPWDENAATYGLAALKFALTLAALENFTLTTALYPALLVVLDAGTYALLIWRRRVLATKPVE